MYIGLKLLNFVLILFIFTYIKAQRPGINNQTKPTTPKTNVTEHRTVNQTANPNKTKQNQTKSLVTRRTSVESTSLIYKIYHLLMEPMKQIIAQPKVNTVLRNVGTCVVNGAMELVAYYFPPTLIPMIASAASMVIPFEPVLMLRDKMPVTSYRRAFFTALNSFLGTFDKYKFDDNYDYDPYMTQRFHRRMMNYGSSEKDKEDKKTKTNDSDKEDKPE